MHGAKARGRTLLGQRRMRAELRHTLSSLLPRHIESVFIDGDSFQVWQKCSGLGRAAAGIESIVLVGELPVQHRLQKCSPAANRRQGQWTML